MYEKILGYVGSAVHSQWYKMERPSVVLEDGHVTHLTWAVADVDKDNQIPAGSNHGSKIIVVPFDGVAFDADTGVVGGAGGASGMGGTRSTTQTAAAGGSATMSGGSSAGGLSGSSTTGGAMNSSASGGLGASDNRVSSAGTTHSTQLAASGGTNSKGDTNKGTNTLSAGSSLSSGGSHSATLGTALDRNGDPGDSGGCSCRVANEGAGSRSFVAHSALGLALLRARRRSRC